MPSANLLQSILTNKLRKPRLDSFRSEVDPSIYLKLAQQAGLQHQLGQFPPEVQKLLAGKSPGKK